VLFTFFQWLQNTSGSTAIRESLYVYQIVESTHVLSLCLFVGLAVILDLRLIGITINGTPVSEISQRILPWTVAGFVLMVASGALLFYSEPARFFLSYLFRLKLSLLVLAAVNVWVFHSTVYRSVAEWDLDVVPPRRARIAGAVSLFLWAAIIVTGRLVAYRWPGLK
jgi:hypothetical protein